MSITAQEMADHYMQQRVGQYDGVDILSIMDRSTQDVGEDVVFYKVNNTLTNHNIVLLDQIILPYCDMSHDARESYYGQEMGFPLKAYTASLGWSRDTMRARSPADLNHHLHAILHQDKKLIVSQIQRAFFDPFNREECDLETGARLKIHPLLNGDNARIPSMSGRVDPYHCHYTYSNGLSYEIICDIVNNLTEHDRYADVEILIHPAMRMKMIDAIRHFPVPVSPFSSSVMINPVTEVVPHAYGDAKIKIESWIPEKHILCVNRGSTGSRPLRYRYRRGRQPYLYFNSDHEHYPLRSSSARRDFCIGVINRHQAVCHYVDDGSVNAYLTPQFNKNLT